MDAPGAYGCDAARVTGALDEQRVLIEANRKLWDGWTEIHVPSEWSA